MHKTIIRLSAALYALLAFAGLRCAHAESFWTDPYNVVWNSPSSNSSQSMPVGGHDIGLNVWVENGDILFYMDRSGSFDENNQMLKLGRVRLTLSPNPFASGTLFRQTLDLRSGAVQIVGASANAAATVSIWVETDRPVIHVDVQSPKPIALATRFESWRFEPRDLTTPERHAAFSLSVTQPKFIRVVTHADQFETSGGDFIWQHRNDNSDLLIDKEMLVQHLSDYRDKIWDPQKDFTFGGLLRTGAKSPPVISQTQYASTIAKTWRFDNEPATQQHVTLFLRADQTPTDEPWKSDLLALANSAEPSEAQAWQNNLAYWKQFWDRSRIVINPDASANDPLWRVGRNYQVFRYMLGCNSAGSFPTKFNGGNFTFDPVYVMAKTPFTPDFRQWGGGSFTLQNQRLVYFPMLKSGDFDLMLPQFEAMLNALPGAELRSEVYWQHGGACYTEQLEDFGLPVGNIYEKFWGNRPIQPRPGSDNGQLLNKWCTDLYDTVLEYCLMMLDYQQYTGRDISRYMPVINGAVEFFDQHYRYEHRQRTSDELDDQGHLVIYPGSGAETYKQATNSTSTIAGLHTVLTRLLQLPASYADAKQRARWQQILDRVPPITFRKMNGHKTIAPAASFKSIENREIPQLYPVFPYGLYGVGKPDLQVAIDTYDFGVDRPAEAKGVMGWRQDPIWMARMGLTDRAAAMIQQKLADSSLRFPTFWGPNFDWTPDLNHGGSAMIALQEMLMQTDGSTIRLLPAWPKMWDVDFVLHAPLQTLVSGKVRSGKLVDLQVTPVNRASDVIVDSSWR